MTGTTIYKSTEGKSIIMRFYDSVLGSWPVPHEDIHVKTHLGDTFVIASGSKYNLPLILLHGASSNAVSWIGEVGVLSQHFWTLTIDIPGDPGRSSANRPPWNSRAYADWLSDVMKGLGIQKAHFLGLSQGGWNAAKFAINFPEKVDKLVLLTPAGITNDNPFFLLRAILYSAAGRKGAEALNRYVFGDEEMDEAVMTFMNAILTHFRPRIERLTLFSDEELKRLSMPVLLIGGDKDRIRNVSKISDRLGKFVPDLTTHILPGKGHVLTNTSPMTIPFLLS